MTEYINYTLPEWVFLDAQSHEGNELEGRTCIMHVRSATVIEIVAMDEVLLAEFEGKNYDFTYLGLLGLEEKHKAIVHFTMAEDEDMEAILQNAAEWYCAYMRWEDNNMMNDEQG